MENSVKVSVWMWMCEVNVLGYSVRRCQVMRSVTVSGYSYRNVKVSCFNSILYICLFSVRLGLDSL